MLTVETPDTPNERRAMELYYASLKRRDEQYRPRWNEPGVKRSYYRRLARMQS